MYVAQGEEGGVEKEDAAQDHEDCSRSCKRESKVCAALESALHSSEAQLPVGAYSCCPEAVALPSSRVVSCRVRVVGRVRKPRGSRSAELGTREEDCQIGKGASCLARCCFSFFPSSHHLSTFRLFRAGIRMVWPFSPRSSGINLDQKLDTTSAVLKVSHRLSLECAVETMLSLFEGGGVHF